MNNRFHTKHDNVCIQKVMPHLKKFVFKYRK